LLYAFDRPAPAVRVEDLWVRFSTTRERKPTLRKTIARRVRSKTRREIEALRGVSFEVDRGSVYGVIGPNGAGKSTLFRIIAGIVPPTEGRVILAGRVTPLLSLGVGFNRDLTGRENILLGGLANGLERDLVSEHFEEIIKFADIGDAIDYPMRTYSNGMFARVGFAVAAHLGPEILLIDEALGAGDADFRRRCQEKIGELLEGDTTVMLVSHGLEIVKHYATRCLWLDHGEARAEGDAGEVVDAYLSSQGISEAAAVMEDF
jgi:ABC-type polysaccharide/polyol phosphate transport system ATPase subunit